MRSLYVLGGPLRRELRAQPLKTFKRFKYQKPDNRRPELFRGKNAKPWEPTASLPETPARTRFAPSPTGYLHLGSLRTALYNYLLAKATKGQFVLRIEDTDQTRVVSDAETRLFEDLRWAGLNWDEGPDVGGPLGPYRQSERLDVYKKHAAYLFKKHRAYRCFCPPKDLEWLKAQKRIDGSPVGYSGTCWHIPRDVSNSRAANGEAYCLRFRSSPAPMVHDLVYGPYRTTASIEDFILLKRDGYPTYHFANVCDDHDMGITHVVRGAEWLVSTPQHILLYNALGWTPPKFAHLGLLTDQDNQKLSKRHGDIDIASYRNKGYLPAALLNYVSLLGWSPNKGEKREKKSSDVMTLEDMIEKFHLKFTKGDIKVNDKLDFLQSKHLSKSDGESGEIFDPGRLASIHNAVTAIETDPETKTRLGAGPLVSAAQATDTTDGPISSQYVEKLFTSEVQSSSYKHRDAAAFAQRVLYLIWEIPPGEHAESLENMMGKIGDFVVADRETPRRWNIGRQPARIVTLFEEALKGIEDWEKTSLESALLPLINIIYQQKAQTPMGKVEATDSQRPWGWAALRWIFSASRPGGSIIDGMLALGKEDTMKRVRSAGHAAMNWEKNHAGNGEEETLMKAEG